jgi:hypothetical protein
MKLDPSQRAFSIVGQYHRAKNSPSSLAKFQSSLIFAIQNTLLSCCAAFGACTSTTSPCMGQKDTIVDDGHAMHLKLLDSMRMKLQYQPLPLYADQLSASSPLDIGVYLFVELSSKVQSTHDVPQMKIMTKEFQALYHLLKYVHFQYLFLPPGK